MVKSRKFNRTKIISFLIFGCSLVYGTFKNWRNISLYWFSSNFVQYSTPIIFAYEFLRFLKLIPRVLEDVRYSSAVLMKQYLHLYIVSIYSIVKAVSPIPRPQVWRQSPLFLNTQLPNPTVGKIPILCSLYVPQPII